MSLYKRGDVWHFDFTIKGERYRGPTGHRSKAKAQRFEEDERERIRTAVGRPAERAELTIEAAGARGADHCGGGGKGVQGPPRRYQIRRDDGAAARDHASADRAANAGQRDRR